LGEGGDRDGISFLPCFGFLGLVSLLKCSVGRGYPTYADTIPLLLLYPFCIFCVVVRCSLHCSRSHSLLVLSICGYVFSWSLAESVWIAPAIHSFYCLIVFGRRNRVW
jgi:hypothetical protein